MKRLIARKSLSEQVAEMVSEEIACGRFSLGQMLSETMIAQELGVSRTPVREAFSHLEFRGLLITKPQSGTYVFDANEAAIKDLFEVSSCMEMQGLQSALQNDESALPKQVSEISEQMTDAFIVKDQDRYSALDRQFHRVFVASSGNKLLTSLSDDYEAFGCLRRGMNITVLFKQKSKEIEGEFLRRLVLGVEGDDVKVFGATIY